MFGEVELDNVAMALAVNIAAKAELTVKQLLTSLVTGRGKVVVKASSLIFVEKDPEVE